MEYKETDIAIFKECINQIVEARVIVLNIMGMGDYIGDDVREIMVHNKEGLL
jgi:hypothetical protein